MAIQSFNKVSIDLKALAHNYRLLSHKAGNAAFLAMVKADAYGHGMLECSNFLEKKGCTIFGVAELCEAVLLRQNGITSEIYSMIGFFPYDADAFSQYDITPVIYDKASLEALSRAAQKSRKNIDVHIKVDTGMNRLGVDLSEIDDLVAAVENLPGITLAGLASHFPCADDVTSKSTDDCFKKFAEFQKRVTRNPSLVNHIANSGGTLYFPHTTCDMVRCGISLYGYYPEGRSVGEISDLKPVMSFSTRVLQIKDIPKGAGVSYGHTYVADRPMKIAVLPVGYEDGLSRRLSNCGEVLLNGKRAPIRGRVCMNLCMVDVTDNDGVKVGDKAVILGEQGDEQITADEIAQHADTISYEVLCMLGNSNKREYT